MRERLIMVHAHTIAGGRARCAIVGVAAVALSAGAAHAGPGFFEFSDTDSTVNTAVNVFGDNGVNGLMPFGGIFVTNAATSTAFVQNAMFEGNTYDWGSFAGAAAIDGTAFERTSGNGRGFIGVDGVGSQTLTVTFEFDANTDNFQNEFRAWASVISNAAVAFRIGGVGSGTLVQLEYDWDLFATAGPGNLSDNAGQPDFPEDIGRVMGDVELDDGSGAIGLFGGMWDDPDRPAPDFDLMDSTGNALNYTTGGPMDYLFLNFDVDAYAEINTMGQAATQEDGSTGSFQGSVTIRIVPAPGAAGLLVIGGLAASRRRRGR